MSDWNEIERPFREALLNAFDRSGLALVLAYHCERRLDRISSEKVDFETNVDDVISAAVRYGWLEKLAQGALAENETNTGLKATVPHILTGVKAEGKSYYQDRRQSEPTSDVSFGNQTNVSFNQQGQTVSGSQINIGGDAKIDHIGDIVEGDT